MNPLSSNPKVLSALLAVMAIGMGVQAYYLVKVHHQLAGEPTHAAEPSRGDRDKHASEEPEDMDAIPAPDPFAELQEAEARVRDLLDDFYARFDSGIDESWFERHPIFADGDSFLFSQSGQFGPRVDLKDKGGQYEMLVDVPGTSESEVQVRVENGMLIIEGSRTSTVEESEQGRFVRRERHSGRFERRLPLPSDADASSLETTYEDGVLRVTLPKSSGDD